MQDYSEHDIIAQTLDDVGKWYINNYDSIDGSEYGFVDRVRGLISVCMDIYLIDGYPITIATTKSPSLTKISTKKEDLRVNSTIDTNTLKCVLSVYLPNLTRNKSNNTEIVEIIVSIPIVFPNDNNIASFYIPYKCYTIKDDKPVSTPLTESIEKYLDVKIISGYCVDNEDIDFIPNRKAVSILSFEGYD